MSFILYGRTYLQESRKKFFSARLLNASAGKYEMAIIMISPRENNSYVLLFFNVSMIYDLSRICYSDEVIDMTLFGE